MSRFEPGMSRGAKMVALSQGLPGAMGILMALSDMHEEFLNIIDRLDIVGADIHLLYEVCGEVPERLAIVLVFADAGTAGLNARKLLHAARNGGEGLDVDGIIADIDNVAAHLNRYLN